MRDGKDGGRMDVTRRTALAGAGAGAGVMLAEGAGFASPGRARRRQNVLWVITDDQPVSTLGKMPSVGRRLVDQGVEFTSGYTAVPWCGPSRVSMQTGLYEHNHGVHNNDTLEGMLARKLERDTVATGMSGAGYRCGYFGKYVNGQHTRPTWVAPGYDRWVALSKTRNGTFNVDGKLREPLGNETRADWFAAEKCASWIARQGRRSGPWFAVFAPTNPHTPYEPSRRHRDKFSGLRYSPPSLNERDMSDKPTWLRGRRDSDVAKVQGWYRGRLRELQDVDAQVEMIMRALAKSEQLGDTWVFFVTDNGYLHGEHRLEKKQQPYEESARTPFVVRPPRGVRGRGTSSAKLVSQVDLMPTALDIAGVRGGARAGDGRSLLGPMVEGDWTGWRKRMMSECVAEDWALLREGDDVFIDHYRRGEHEAYDLRLDPFQLQSVHAGMDPVTKRSSVERLTAMRGARGDRLRSLEV